MGKKFKRIWMFDEVPLQNSIISSAYKIYDGMVVYNQLNH